MSQNERLIELETRIAHQDHTIHALSEEIYRHQKKLDHLEVTCNFLVAQLKAQPSASASTDADNDKPPHY